MSYTKKLIVQRHLANPDLQSAILMPMPASSLDLSVDQPTDAVDASMAETAATALEQGQTHYVDVPGIAPLREKLAGWLASLGLVGYETANVLVAAGVQEARFLTIQMIGAAHGGIGVPAVAHPGVRLALGTRALSTVELPVGDDLLPTLDGLRAALAGGCKLLYLESPSRLTGAAFDAQAVQAIGALLQEHDASAVWDQGLAPWAESYVSLGSLPGLAERVAVLGEAWPGVGLESWFVAYVGANPAWLESMRSQKQIIAICTSTASQYAALQGADVFGARHAQTRTALNAQNIAARAAAREVGAEPLDGAAVNILAARIPAGAAEKLREAGVGFADGADFGAPGVVRLAVTLDTAIDTALRALTAENQ